MRYLNERSAGERSWQELRLGFFDSEAAARARLDSLRAQFPDSVIAVASVAEQDEAGARRLYAAQSAAAPPGTSAVGALPELSPERREALAAEANDASAAVEHFRKVLQWSPTHYGARFQLARSLEIGRASCRERVS